MARLIPIEELVKNHGIDLSGADDPTGNAVYSANDEKIGTVRGVMADPSSGRLRYLIADVGGWFSDKQVLVPVGKARFEDDAVHLDGLTKDQVGAMSAYHPGGQYEDEARMNDERVLRGGDDGQVGDLQDSDMSVIGGLPAPQAPVMSAPVTPAPVTPAPVIAEPVTPAPVVPAPVPQPERQYNDRDEDEEDSLYKTPDKLRLLEERLAVHKEKFSAGSVDVGKHVERRDEQVKVNLAREEAVIERHPVSDPQPVEGNVTLGSDTQTVRVDLEAERANLHKQAYVTEEITVGEREVSEQQTLTETVQKEVLDVNKTGNLEIEGKAGQGGKDDPKDKR